GSRKREKAKSSRRKKKTGEKHENKATPSPVQARIQDKDGDDVEAARERTRSPSASTSWLPGVLPDKEAIDELKLNKDKDPADWMRVGETTGMAFLWYTVMLQIATACCSIMFLASERENQQLSWKTGCWGLWTSLSDTKDVEFVEFDTHIGWQLYGKGDKLGLLSEVSDRTAVVGGLAGGMHTLVVLIAGGFFLFSLPALCLSYSTFFCTRRGSSPSKEGSTEAGEDGPIETVHSHSSPLVLARDCHRWLFAMAGMNIFAGLWCFGVGCAGFYLVVARDLTQGLEDIIAGWGESVSCAKPQTSPRYGFFVNGLSVLLLLGGGIISLFKTYSSHRDLSEAAEMWKNDRAEVAEMQSRLAMIRKKEEYAAAVASAAASAAESPPVIFKSRKSVTASTAAPASKRVVPAAPPGGSSCSRSSRFSAQLPPSPRGPSSIVGVPATGRREPHMRKTSTVAFAPVDLEHGEYTGARSIALSKPLSVPGSPCLPSPEPELSSRYRDIERGSGAAYGPAASDDLPPPQGWEIRTTPSGDKFWVNLLSKNVSWDRPT
ncbi:unnamed protein product, partial [Hapterophycus canaliculatus]